MSAIDLDAIEKRAAEAWAAREHPSAGDALALVAEVRALRGDLKEARAVAAELHGVYVDEYGGCRFCPADEGQPHAPSCRLKAALGEG